MAIHTVTDWLEQLGLGQYADAFAENAIDLDILLDLTEADLRELGVTSLGHRKTILKGIATLPTQDGRSSGTTSVHADSSGPIDEAERRQLTVMFVDLVGSTELSTRLDPEDLRDIIGNYQNTVAGSIAHYEGHVARFMGDGVLAYFGWPQAHEDEAGRAIRAGLEAAAAVTELKTATGEDLTARVGIATGTVIVGDLVGKGKAQEEAVVGETPNLAARLQGIARPGRVVIDALTRRLVGDAFELQPMGEQSVKGFDSLSAWQVIAARDDISRFEVSLGKELTPFVGRQSELSLLRERWDLACSGEGQVVLLSGEPGIGKSRLVEMLDAETIGGPCFRLHYQCSPYHTSSVLHPIIQQLREAALFTTNETDEVRLSKLERFLRSEMPDDVDIVPLFAELFSIPYEGHYVALNLPPQQRKDRVLEALIEMLRRRSAKQPVLMIFEDAHWIDPTSREFLERWVPQTANVSVLLLITHRPEWRPSFGTESHATALELNRLSRAQAKEIVTALGGGSIKDALRTQIIDRTDGIPLFVEEVTRSVLEVTDENFEVPDSLRTSLLARLDRLGTAKQVAQMGSVVGREFAYNLVAAVYGQPLADLNAALERLVNARLVYQSGVPPEAIYTFKHALVQNVAYESLLRNKRRQLHANIARSLQRHFPDIVAMQPEVLARHLTEAGIFEEAVSYWHRAAQHALARSADAETITHVNSGLELVKGLEDQSLQATYELNLRLALGPALMNTKGSAAGEVEQNYLRARQLSEQLDLPEQRFAALWGLWLNHDMAGRLKSAQRIASGLIDLAEGLSDSTFLLQGYHSAWSTELDVGNFTHAMNHAAQGIALYDIHQHRTSAYVYGGHDAGVCGYSCALLLDWFLGYPNRALQRARDALSLAEAVANPFSLAQALFYTTVLHQLCGEPEAVAAKAEELVAHSRANDLVVWVLNGKLLHNWALAKLGQTEAGIAEFSRALDERRAMNIKSRQSYYLTILAELLADEKQLAQGIAAIGEALDIQELSSERTWESITHRVHGRLLLAQSNETQAEQRLKRALNVARRQNARSLELQAATDLADFWCLQGKVKEANDVLAPVYGSFTEGFDTGYLCKAGSLLEKLS